MTHSSLDWSMTPPVTRYSAGQQARRQGGLLLNVQVPPARQALPTEDVVAWLQQQIPEPHYGALPPPSGVLKSAHDAAHWLGYWLNRLQRFASLPVFEAPLYVPDEDSEQRGQLYLPTYPGSDQATLNLVKWLLTILIHRADNQALQALMPQLAGVMQALRACAPGSANVGRFLYAAFEQRLPVISLGHHQFQVGIGASQVRLDSSFTGGTAVMAANLVRNKAATNEFLAQAGLSIPKQAILQADSPLDNLIERLGAPVVCKPMDRDGGQGVHLFIKDHSTLQKAVTACLTLSDDVLVQQQVTGRDYRLTVYNGECIWAIERVPAQVVGDGICSVEALIKQENAKPNRAGRGHSPLKPVPDAQQAQALLQEQGLTASAIPAAGQVVRLSQLPNVAAGGQPFPMFEQLHPDNAELAALVARLCGLDMAGIDLIMSDITRSWHEVGAWIIEVNAQPDIGQTTAAHLYGELLQRMLPEAPVLIKRVDTSTQKHWGKGDRVSAGERLWHGTAWSDCPESLTMKVAWARQCLLDRACTAIWLDEASWEWFRQAATDLAIQ